MAGLLIFLILGVVNALPDPTIRNLTSDDLGKYQETWGNEGKAGSKLARYNPDFDNQYHLFTRLNPTISQPLVPGDGNMLLASNYWHMRKAVVIFHGWTDSAVGDFAAMMVPALLQSGDFNVITVDWSVGAFVEEDLMPHAMRASGHSVAAFISWLMDVTGVGPLMFHFVGFDLGAHHAALTGRFVPRGVGHITGLDPCSGGFFPQDTFHFNDALYTEAIFTNAGFYGHRTEVADTNFYPNGGYRMPGCGVDDLCSHARAFHYFAESVVFGGFTGTRCENIIEAQQGNCNLPGPRWMGSRDAAYGAKGIFYLQTNELPPYSRG